MYWKVKQTLHLVYQFRQRAELLLCLVANLEDSRAAALDR
jgi:hypothetical protein